MVEELGHGSAAIVVAARVSEWRFEKLCLEL
jgi:hypothetical protein